MKKEEIPRRKNPQLPALGHPKTNSGLGSTVTRAISSVTRVVNSRMRMVNSLELEVLEETLGLGMGARSGSLGDW